MPLGGVQRRTWTNAGSVAQRRKIGAVKARRKTDMALKICEFSATEVTDQSAAIEADYWSPENTAKRILDMARSLANGDPGKIGLLRGAVEKGFRDAEKILGGLPNVCKETYRLVMDGFDDWAREGGFDATA